MLNESKNHCNQVRSNFTYKVPHGERYFINMKMKGANGQFKDVRILADSGNDTTILTRRTAESLGFDPRTMKGESFFVKGINGQPAEFKEINSDIILGDMHLRVPIGLATKDEDLSDNLLGRAGIIDSGLVGISFDNDSVDIINKKRGAMKVSVCGSPGCL